MGINFYWRTEPPCEPMVVRTPLGDEIEVALRGRDDPCIHIGKVSTRGLYCWDCNRIIDTELGRDCEKCEKPVPALSAESWMFGGSRTERPTGITQACAFLWAQNRHRVLDYCRARPEERAIVTEYGKVMTCGEFLQMILCNCPIHEEHHGEKFS